MKIKLTQDRVLLKRIVQNKVGDILLPDEVSRRQSNRFTVVAVGPGRMTDCGEIIPPPVNVGDTVMVDKEGLEINIDGVTYNIILPTNVLVVL